MLFVATLTATKRAAVRRRMGLKILTPWEADEPEASVGEELVI